VAGVDTDGMPHIYGDRPEWSAMAKFKTESDRDLVLEKMRFFKWVVPTPGDKPNLSFFIRTLAMDPNSVEKEENTAGECKMTVRKLPAQMTHPKLYDEILKGTSAFGIKSVKVFMDKNNES